MNEPKVLLVCEAMGGGVRKHIIDIINEFDLLNFEIHLAYSPNRVDNVFNSFIEVNKKKLNLYSIESFQREIGLRNEMKTFVKLNKIVKKIQPDVIHCHSSKAGLHGRIVGKFNRVKNTIYTPHAYIMQSGDLSNKKRLLFTTVEKLLSKYFTDITINVSEGENQFAIENNIITKEKSKVIYNGLKRNKLDIDSQGHIKNKFVVGTVARLNDQKDPQTFYNIAKKVTEVSNNIEFVYVGDGPYLNEFKEKILYEGLEDKIKFLGFKSDPLKEIILMDIFLSTSLYEGMPYSLIEAISLGKPLIATDIVGNNEVVINNYNGELFEVKDIKDASSKILKLVNEIEIMKSYSKNSLALFEEKFEITNMIDDLKNIYSK